MRLPSALIAGLLLAAAVPAAAQEVARSAGPQTVSVTVYRDPNRAADSPMNLGWLNGFALVTEKRRVSIPAGESVIRFEGVAGGILPESAIVTGFPEDVIEKNQDAWLLSPASLLDASLGKRVHLRRTNRATGAVREMEAVARSGPAGAVVLETPDGIEALRCDGLPETLVYDRVPPGLSAKPTLSVRVRSASAASATVTLSYIASGFDWQANYVGRLSGDGKRVDLFAWLTLANGDETGFREADTQAVAGRLNRSSGRAGRPQAPPLVLRCWPQGTTTSDLEETMFEREEIVVTGTRIANRAMAVPVMAPPAPPPPPQMMAQQEELGDLKLYRIPEPVTVAAKSQKQVALLDRKGVEVETVWRGEAMGRGAGPIPTLVTLRTTNVAQRGLGLPLPSGGVALFAERGDRPVLVGRGSLADKAVGEKVEVDFATATSVSAALEDVIRDGKPVGRRLVVANAGPRPARYEAKLPDLDGGSTAFSRSVHKENGRWIAVLLVPANGTASIEWHSRSSGD